MQGSQIFTSVFYNAEDEYSLVFSTGSLTTVEKVIPSVTYMCSHYDNICTKMQEKFNILNYVSSIELLHNQILTKYARQQLT